MYAAIADVLLHTGFRIVEFWAFVDHPEWYHAAARCIDLPPEGSAKKGRVQYKERSIQLTLRGCEAVEHLQKMQIPPRTRWAMGGAFKRAAKKSIGVKGVTPKMFRKTLISWLVAIHKGLGIDTLDIGASAGHSMETLRIHYLGIGFSADDNKNMYPYLEGWGRK